jgi:thiol-disulfide isomerase/thioredoxin
MSSSADISKPLLSPKSSILSKKNMIILLLIISILLICGGVYYWKYMRNPEGYVDSDNSDKPSFKLYYADWCGWSKKFLPEWDKLVEDSIKDKVDLVKYECATEENKQICEDAKIQGFPSMKYYKDSSDKDGIEYDGERTSEEISKWINDKL